MGRVVRYIIWLLLLILSQIFIFDKIDLFGYLNIYVYILILLMLPMEIKPALLLIIGFALGALMDLLSGVLGLFMITTTLLAFLRPAILNLTAKKEIVSMGGIPSVKTMRRGQFIEYVTAIVLIHNITVMTLETMTLTGIVDTIIRIVVSTAVTVPIIYFLHLLQIRRA